MPAVRYPRRIPLAHVPTPLRHLERLSHALGGADIWIKCDHLTGGALSGNKVRKLEFSIAEALDQGADTLITCGGLQSNHCRATAAAGARLGLRVRLVLRGLPSGTPDGNLFLDHLLGADVSCYPPEFYRARLDEILAGVVEDYARQGRTAYVIPTGASNDVGLWGYIAAAEELAADFARLNLHPQHIVCATGSGGTQAGLILGNALFDLGVQVWGVNVCDDEAHFVNKIRSDMRAWKAKYHQPLDVESLPINILDGHKGPGYAKTTPELLETIARVAQTEGLVLDPVYTGKAFLGMIKEMQRGRFKRGETILFIHTGGLFGLFPHRADFGFKEVPDTVF